MLRSQNSLEATMTEIIEGPITATDRVYAFDKIRQVYPSAPSLVPRARARLAAPASSDGVVAGDRRVHAGARRRADPVRRAVGSSVRDAVDELKTRLRRRPAASAPRVQPAPRELRSAGRSRTVRQPHLGLRTDRNVL